MTATNIRSNFGGMWDSPPLIFLLLNQPPKISHHVVPGKHNIGRDMIKNCNL